MLKKTKALKFIPGKGYDELVKSTKADLAQLESLVRTQTVSVMWKLGKSAHEHLLKNKGKVGYGYGFFENFAKDIGRDVTSVQRSIKFYLTYPSIPASRQELSWTQYRQLITIQDPDKRKQLEEQFIKKQFDTRKSQEYLNFKKSQLAAKNDPDKPIEQLSFTRGVLFTYGVVEDEDIDSRFLLDLGFTLRKVFPQANDLGLKAEDYVRQEPLGSNSFVKVTASRENIFTYKAQVLKVIDGDTLTTLIELGLGLFAKQKLRLRGIDCPEMDTDEGVQAKKFVEARLNKCDFIIVKTYKDSSDKYDRYLADIFYLADEKDPYEVAQQGVFLNQELLDKGLAVIFG